MVLQLLIPEAEVAGINFYHILENIRIILSQFSKYEKK